MIDKLHSEILEWDSNNHIAMSGIDNQNTTGDIYKQWLLAGNMLSADLRGTIVCHAQDPCTSFLTSKSN
jgi:hypothetical protein